MRPKASSRIKGQGLKAQSRWGRPALGLLPEGPFGEQYHSSALFLKGGKSFCQQQGVLGCLLSKGFLKLPSPHFLYPAFFPETLSLFEARREKDPNQRMRTIRNPLL
jgi:hypothetical protein